MELVVVLVAVVGLVAVVVRFVARPGVGGRDLPRIVDESIGMWVLRRLTGRAVPPTPEDESPPAAARALPFDAATARRLGIVPASALLPPGPSAGSATPATPATPTAPAMRGRTARGPIRPVTIALLVVAAAIVGAAVGGSLAMLVPPAHGGVLATTGTPVPSLGAGLSPSPSIGP